MDVQDAVGRMCEVRSEVEDQRRHCATKERKSLKDALRLGGFPTVLQRQVGGYRIRDYLITVEYFLT